MYNVTLPNLIEWFTKLIIQSYSVHNWDLITLWNIYFSLIWKTTEFSTELLGTYSNFK